MLKRALAYMVAALFLCNATACADSFWLRPIQKDEAESDSPALYQQGALLATAQSMEDAQAIAELYGITLEYWEDGLARFSTDRDVNEMIRQGQENGWPTLSRNDYAELK